MTIPSIFGGGRRHLFLWLALNGFCQALVTVAVSLTLSKSFVNGGSIGTMPNFVIHGLLAAAVSVMALRTLERAQAEQLGQHYVTACRLRLFQAFSKLPLRGGPAVRYGITMTRMITDLTSMKNWVARGVAKLTVAGFSISGVIAALLVVNPALAAVTSVALITLVAIGLIASIFFRARVREVRRLRGRLAANVGELMRARGLVWHFGRMSLERARLRNQSREMSRSLVRRSILAGLMRSLSETLMPFTIAGAVIAATSSSSLSELSVAELATGLFLIGFASSPLRDLMLALEYHASFLIGRRKLRAAFSNFNRLGDSTAYKKYRGAGPASLTLNGAVIPELSGPLHAALLPGEQILLIGESGSGKTGLLNGIAGLSMFEVRHEQAGIKLDGYDLCAISPSDWHRRVKLVSSDLPLLKGSLSRNVRYGAPSLSERSVKEILERCGVDAGSRYFPDGLKTRLNEGSGNLPSGLRSRIALARAMASNPGILLVDDYNFLVDGECQEALRNLASLRAVSIIVASPAKTDILQWDQVWRLNGGRLISAVDGCSNKDYAKSSNRESA